MFEIRHNGEKQAEYRNKQEAINVAKNLSKLVGKYSIVTVWDKTDVVWERIDL